MSNIIYTLGTGTRCIESFFKIIKNKNIEIIVDVRRFPTSKFEEFKKQNLERICKEEGIEYAYFGNKLGGFRKGGYEKYMETNQFARGIDKIAKIADNKTICIICAETLPWKCHRRFIAKRLMEIGYEVIHIIDEKHTWRQSQNVKSASNPVKSRLGTDPTDEINVGGVSNADFFRESSLSCRKRNTQ